MRPACALALLLLACLISITPLADASSPDPTWTVGLSDDADGDDTVVSLTSAAWVVELTPPVSLIPLFVAVPFDLFDLIGLDDEVSVIADKFARIMFNAVIHVFFRVEEDLFATFFVLEANFIVIGRAAALRAP